MSNVFSNNSGVFSLPARRRIVMQAAFGGWRREKRDWRDDLRHDQACNDKWHGYQLFKTKRVVARYRCLIAAVC